MKNIIKKNNLEAKDERLLIKYFLIEIYVREISFYENIKCKQFVLILILKVLFRNKNSLFKNSNKM